jgi:hypothetical protein
MQAYAPARACKPALHADTPTDRPNLLVLGHTVAWRRTNWLVTELVAQLALGDSDGTLPPPLGSRKLRVGRGRGLAAPEISVRRAGRPPGMAPAATFHQTCNVSVCAL